ncbi:MAG: DNA translocase FtsK [bacterium]
MSRSAKKRGAPSRRGRVLFAVFLGTVAALLAVALGAYLQDGNWRQPVGTLAHRMGRVSYAAASGVVRWCGVLGAWLVAVALGAFAIRLAAGRPLRGFRRRALVAAALGVAIVQSFAALPGAEATPERAFLAGAIGTGIVKGLRALFGGLGAAIALCGATAAYLATVGLPLFTPLARLASPFRSAAKATADVARRAAAETAAAFTPGTESAPARRAARARDRDEEDEDEGDEDDIAGANGDAEAEAEDAHEGPPLRERLAGYFSPRAAAEPEAEEAPEHVPVVVLPSAGEPRSEPDDDDDDDLLDAPGVSELTNTGLPYVPPPRNFLEQEEDDEADALAKGDLLESAKLLERTLHSFGVRGKVTQVQPGPVITRYEIEPAAGQKVAPIASLSDDLALALRARSIRIVAPIPGKAAVGIEVPNPSARIVRLGSLLETPEFADEESPLNIALGRDISGDPFCVALDRMPHVLVAGATGSGKSVCINTMITSMIYRAGPENVRFVMIDPKMLELTTYVGLPHVIPPVVSQPKDASRLLKWAVSEMEVRYRSLAHLGVRSIADYNKKLMAEGAPRMPYLVVIVDELADLMLSNQKQEIEDSIARLAQMARAVGIHLVVATQRPSVDVITGVIKANFPSRIAFQVPTRTDSRTILDSIGAEKLLGRGDMLYLGVGMAEPVRVHGSFISTEETNDIVEWLRARNPRPAEVEEAEAAAATDDLYPTEREDDLFEEASKILVAHQQGSISLLQRRLKVGYARAARLVDMMEEAGIVGPFTGSKAREILVPNLDELEKKLAAARRSPLGGTKG